MRNRIVCAAVLSGLMLHLAGAAASPARPNIVFILADDLGYTDLSCYGSRYYETPHIDRLAAQGLRLTSGYTCGPNCAPTRAALLSGQYAPRTGIYTVGSIDRFNWQSRPLRPVDNQTRLPLDKVTLPQALKAAGYVTGMFGKWHLGEAAEYHPSKRGFDEALCSAGRHFNFETDPPTEYPPGTYLADFLTDKGLDFIRRHKEQPFFLYLPHFAVHAPLEAKAGLIDKFKAKTPVAGHHNPTYAAMIASVDQSVGRVMALLDELNLADKTLVIFSSDNGGVGGYVREGIKLAGDVTDNAPLRGGKASLRGRVRVPYIFRWPGMIPAGATSDRPINAWTSIQPFEIAGANPPRATRWMVQLRSIAPVRRPERTGARAVVLAFPRLPGAGPGPGARHRPAASRVGDWKLLEFFEDSRPELYNLKHDLSETNNLAQAQPAKVRELHAQLRKWREEIKAPMPTPNTPQAGRRLERRRKNARQPAAGAAVDRNPSGDRVFLPDPFSSSGRLSHSLLPGRKGAIRQCPAPNGRGNPVAKPGARREGQG